MTKAAYALTPRELLRSMEASSGTFADGHVDLVSVVGQVDKLTNGARLVVLGGLAQMLWARKTHMDDLDLALATSGIQEAYRRVRVRAAGAGWSLPRLRERAHEENDVFEVCHQALDLIECIRTRGRR